MQRPEVAEINKNLIPDNSLAHTAAKIISVDGVTKVIELFRSQNGTSVDFRGLPDHLANEDEMTISLEASDDLLDSSKVTKHLFEFAIGARQTLPNGASVHYADESSDPMSRHYRHFRPAR